MIFDNPIFSEMLLPFLLVFVVVFAILQKSKVLGDGKAQIDALVSLAIALILIIFPQPRSIVVELMPWLAVGVSVILVFLILYGFVAGDLSGENVKPWMKIVFGILAGLFVTGVVVYVSGAWSVLLDWFSFGGDVWLNVFLIFIIIGAVVVAVVSGKSGSGKE